MFNASSTRLNKYISESGICSRRDADRFIEQGNVFINGKRASVGDQVVAGDTVRVNGQIIEPQDADDFVFIVLNKPVGIVSTTESSERHNIVDFVSHGVRIFPIGRLDKDSQGLIFLTNNGDLVNKVLRAGNNHEKEYLVTVNKPITESFLSGLAGGVPILGTMTKKCPVVKVAPNVFNITLVQGLNRQIRRMCEHFGYEVTKLERTRIMNVNLKGLPVGEWRDLTQKELSVLLKSIEDSSSEASAPAKKSRNAPRKNTRNDGASKPKASTKPKAPFKPTGAAKGNTKHPKDDSRKPAGSKGKDRRPFGDANKPAKGRKPTTNKPQTTKPQGKSNSNKPTGKRPIRGKGPR
ncbi:23S rRNA pseudouridine(2604) synthase RluF [Marinomonas rhizomae]|uniref:Pseudouridine synthase n=1 Tax=Marinomonas rhizomae TaxID=491948 RepID=A0A366IV80_9GAMM|nr:23S rRNA pseudouridine(2604) synthase RluF [Marinomonas rhizomae]RBP77934.1 ribosomal large subunit pseudouridine synthase F [Marinomonas rhizomae]RNF68912.1 23S rRNA pseudouridine(2604) synthase RluF [Marinomonas rhizomae]